jgi:hypothetical protein
VPSNYSNIPTLKKKASSIKNTANSFYFYKIGRIFSL